MKRILFLTGILLVSVALFAQNPRSQQGKGAEKKEENTRQQERSQQAREGRQQGNEQAQQQQEAARQQAATEQERGRGQQARQGEQESPGHAYGRNKEGLSGRDFGQARAAAARNRQEKEQVTREVATEVEQGVERTTRTVEVARDTLQRRERRGEISEEEYQRRVRRVAEIEAEIKQIEQERRGTQEVIRQRIP